MSQAVLIIIIVAAAAIIIFLFVKNQKDKKEFAEKIKNDYPHKKAGDEDINVEEKM